MVDRDPLADRLKLHAYELVNGGANASQLRADLVEAANRLSASVERPQPIETPAANRPQPVVDRDPIELIEKLKEGWRAKAHGYRTAVGGKYAVVGDAYARCADELDALLGSARLPELTVQQISGAVDRAFETALTRSEYHGRVSRAQITQEVWSELQALRSARLQKERKGEDTLTHVDSRTLSDFGATGGKNELASTCACGYAPTSVPEYEAAVQALQAQVRWLAADVSLARERQAFWETAYANISEYAQHKPECEYGKGVEKHTTGRWRYYQCTCGLEEALAPAGSR